MVSGIGRGIHLLNYAWEIDGYPAVGEFRIEFYRRNSFEGWNF
jgi:hypothetical protein